MNETNGKQQKQQLPQKQQPQQKQEKQQNQGTQPKKDTAGQEKPKSSRPNKPRKPQKPKAAAPAAEPKAAVPAEKAAKKPRNRRPRKDNAKQASPATIETAAGIIEAAAPVVKEKKSGRKGNNKLRIVPLGGMNEIGKNMTAIELNDEIIIIDSGIKFPDDEMPGIDVIIPDISYLIKNKSKVRGIVLTHGHEDHIGALPYVLRDLNVPVYGTRFTLGLVERKLKEHSQLKNIRLQVVKQGQSVRLGGFEVEFIRVCHSIPDSVALALHTALGTIVHTGDFKIDYTPIDGQPTDLQRFGELGKQGVLLLMAESTNVERPGYTMSESTVGDTFETIFRHAEDRIIIASFASNVHRIQQVVDAARDNNRKIAFSGRSMVNTVEIATELGYLNIPKEMIIDVVDLHRYPDNEVAVVTTGSQGEPLSALARMANDEHRQMQIQPGDLVIFSSSPIPGNEKSVKKIINSLFEKGANVIYESLAEVHVSGHACQEEIKLIHSLVKPKYFIPVHGEFSHLRQHALLAKQMGMGTDRIFVLDNGDTVEFTEDSAKAGNRVPNGVTLIDGLGIGDVGNIVLRDRKLLAEEGLIVVVVALAKENGAIISGPDVISRGFVYVRESEELMGKARDIVRQAVNKCSTKGVKEWSSYKNQIKDDLNNYLYQTMKRSPVILPIIVEIEGGKA